MTNQFKVSIYIRVSTSKQANEGDSLDEQEKELKKFCEYKNYLIHKTHIEAGRSAKDTNRPEYQRLMKDIEAGKINAVVVKKLDRLSRSLLDFEGFMVTAQKHNVEFISLKENFDTTTAMGKAMLRVALVFAQLEREQTAERISDVMTYRAEQGLRNGGITPYGYDCLDKELVPHHQHKKIVELIFEKFIETKSTVEVAKTLNEAGFRNRKGQGWDCRRIHDILTNETYIGKILWAGNVYEGIHQPLVSQKKHEAVQHILSRRRQLPEKQMTAAILQGLLFCGDCHSPMTPSHSLNHQRKKFFYYRCTSTNSSNGKKSSCQLKYTSLKAIEARVLNLLLSLPHGQAFQALESQITKYNQAIERNIQDLREILIVQENQISTIKAKKDHYLDSLIANQFLSSERQRITDKLEELDQEEKQAKSNIYKQQFEVSQKTDEQINLSNFKQLLVAFKNNYDTFAHTQLKEFLVSNIQEIIYFPNKLSIHFRLLPWSVEFEA